MTTYCEVLIEKATGKRWLYGSKVSWKRVYYTCDNGDTWHRAKGKAFREAQRTGKLRSAETCEWAKT